MGLEDLYKYKLPKENISAKYIEYKESILQFFVNFGKPPLQYPNQNTTQCNQQHNTVARRTTIKKQNI